MSELEFIATCDHREMTLDTVTGTVDVSGEQSSSQLLFLPAAESVTLRVADLLLFTYVEPPETAIITDPAGNVSQRSAVYLEGNFGTALLHIVAAEGWKIAQAEFEGPRLAVLPTSKQLVKAYENIIITMNGP